METFELIASIRIVFRSVVAFCIRGFDKYAARTEKRRIPEKTLLIISAIGGSLGAIIGSNFFRHKTIKSSFITKLYLIIAVQIVVLAVYLGGV